MLRVWGCEEVALPSIVQPRLFLSPDNTSTCIPVLECRWSAGMELCVSATVQGIKGKSVELLAPNRILNSAKSSTDLPSHPSTSRSLPSKTTAAKLLSFLCNVPNFQTYGYRILRKFHSFLSTPPHPSYVPSTPIASHLIYGIAQTLFPSEPYPHHSLKNNPILLLFPRPKPSINSPI